MSSTKNSTKIRQRNVVELANMNQVGTLISLSDKGRRHCSGSEYRSKSEGRSPSHFTSGVVSEQLS